jgi:asparagine synthase (glutamine-hydrolysing)
VTPTVSSLDPLEIACGLVFGLDEQADTMAARRAASNPRRELERAVRRALERSPCLVSFSGGRDSSAILALATHVARRDGLPLPIPATNRFAGVPLSDETSWQEQVVSHLGLDEWIVLEHTDELDCIGSYATAVLRRHGLLWPFNVFFHEPFVRLAEGGALLTGIGGDEMLGESPWHRFRASLKGRRPAPRDALRVGYLCAPRRLRRYSLERRTEIYYPWLRPDARREVLARYADQASRVPLRWRAHVQWVKTLRYLRVGSDSQQALAEAGDVLEVHPFLDAGFISALSVLPRSERFADRTAAMRALFGDLLPAGVIGRRTKASFDGAFWNEPSRAFAAEWDGTGVDTALVDVDALRAEWLSESPDARSYTLAQALWLARSAAAAPPRRTSPQASCPLS